MFIIYLSFARVIYVTMRFCMHLCVELQDEREKYRKNLENELKKLQQSNIDAMAAYDESLTILFNK